MSGTNIFNPPPGRWGEWRVGDSGDTRTKNFATDLSQIPDTIAAVTGVTITRVDGAAMTGSDLALLSAPTLAPNGLSITIAFTGGIAGVTYDIAISVLTAQGRNITRDTLMTVGAAVG